MMNFMYVVAVAPIKRGIPIDELSYFTKDPISPGALVTIPLRGRPTPGLVIRSIPATEAKSELRQAQFALKKLERVRASNFFSPAFIRAAESTAKYFAAGTGATIGAVFPNALLGTKGVSEQKVPEGGERHGQRFIFQSEEEDRFATYKSHIREVFARGESCYFVLPTLQDIEHCYAKLEKGISNYTFILHSGLTKKETEKRWSAILATKHPVLIIGTPLFLSIPRSDITSIILDKESASGYQLNTRPFIDMRFYVEEFAKESGADLILGDLFLRVETALRYSRGEFEGLLRPKSRIPSTATQHIIDMRTSGEQPATGKVAICSAELVELIEEVRKKGTHIFILGVRRGFSPMTVCGDCGTVVTCTRCAAPMVIHKRSGKAVSQGDGEAEHIFLCHRCGLERETDVTCTHCGGWRLVPLGIGITAAEESLRRRFPDATIFRIDRDSVERHEDAKKIVEKFYQTPGSILLGTEMALPYLTSPVATVAVLSVNSLLTIPDFRMGERVFRLLLLLREKAREHFLIQTRDPEMKLFELVTGGNIGEFVRTELEARKELSYPPFSTMIKFTHQGGKVEGGRALEDIERIFGSYHPVTFPSFISKVRGKYIMNALLRIPKDEGQSAWPNEELLGLIRALPPDVEVRVNPDNII